jgi:hypothetical protein
MSYSITRNLGRIETAPTIGVVSIDGTGAITVPVGTTAERPVSGTEIPVTGGMVRFNTDSSQLEFYFGSGWRSIDTTASSTPPANPSLGDLWYDTANSSLNYWNGIGWVPLNVLGTNIEAQQNSGNNYLNTQVNGQNVAQFSATTFTPSPAITGFPQVYGGITMSTNSAFNSITSGSVVPVTASTYNLGSPSDQWENLYSVNADISGQLNSASVIPNANDAYNLGSPSEQWANAYMVDADVSGQLNSASIIPNANDLYNLGSPSAQWAEAYMVGADITGTLTLGGSSTVQGNIIPSSNGTYNLGSPSEQYGQAYVQGITVSGTATFNGPVIAAGGYENILPATTATYVVGNSSFQWENGNFLNLTIGNLNGGGTVTGNWSLAGGSTWEATYADIAEKFEADSDDLLVGMLVSIGGAKDITRTFEECSMDVFGVVSESAAFRMNSELGRDTRFPFIALSGTVPIRVVGKVQRGQRLVSSRIPGYARAITNEELLELDKKAAFVVIGRALEDKETEEMGLLGRAVVNIRI